MGLQIGSLCIFSAIIVNQQLYTFEIYSHFYPFVNFLRTDESPGTLENWSENECKMLQDSVLVGMCSARKEELRSRYDRVRKTINSVYCDDRDFGSSVSYDLYRWSWHVIQARAFGRRIPWSALVPLADCLNHANKPVRYALDSVQNNLSGSCMSNRSRGDLYDPDGGLFTIFPSGDNMYKKGTEVFNSYGRR